MTEEANACSSLRFADPPLSKLVKLREVAEVFPDTEYAVMVLLGEFADGTFVVWSERKATSEFCTGAVICRDIEASLKTFKAQVDEIVEFACPDACA